MNDPFMVYSVERLRLCESPQMLSNFLNLDYDIIMT